MTMQVKPYYGDFFDLSLNCDRDLSSVSIFAALIELPRTIFGLCRET